MVLCDRFADSTRAYQGGGRGVDADILSRCTASPPVASAGAI